MEPSQTPPAPTNSLLFGRFGLRAWVGLSLFIPAVWLLGFTDLWGTASLPLTEAVLLQDGTLFLGLLAACWFLARMERRPLRSYGVGKAGATNVFAGAFWGLTWMSALVAVLHAGHWLVFDKRLLHGATIVHDGLFLLLVFLCVGLAEEYMFRGYLQFTLMRGFWGVAEATTRSHTRAVAFWSAAIVTSLLFTLAHTLNTGETFTGEAVVFLAGLTFAYALWRTGSLWWSIGFHMAWDWAESFLFGVADSGNMLSGRLFATHPSGRTLYSGGSDGPEGSIFAILALLGAIFVIHFTTRRGEQPALAPEPLSGSSRDRFHSLMP